MRVSDVFALAGTSGSDYDYGDSYSNFGCSAGDCYAGDYGRFSYYYYSHSGWIGGSVDGHNGLRNASATRGRGLLQTKA
ncbi:MAG: hypothetical protein DLM62_21255 [Pseudonocardiales bacterium]|nr:MAG: hypothetical protein DLM62_21255 [Pseudonocardiales bacterium]